MIIKLKKIRYNHKMCKYRASLLSKKLDKYEIYIETYFQREYMTFPYYMAVSDITLI